MNSNCTVNLAVSLTLFILAISPRRRCPVVKLAISRTPRVIGRILILTASMFDRTEASAIGLPLGTIWDLSLYRLYLYPPKEPIHLQKDSCSAKNLQAYKAVTAAIRETRLKWIIITASATVIGTIVILCAIPISAVDNTRAIIGLPISNAENNPDVVRRENLVRTG